MPLVQRAAGAPTKLYPGYGWATATINRPAATGDTDGNPVGTLTSVSIGTLGFWDYATVVEQQVAAQRGEVVDSSFATSLATDIRINDQVVVRGHTYEVVSVQDVRNYTLAMLRLMV